MSELLSAGLFRLGHSKLLRILLPLLALVTMGYLASAWNAALRYYPDIDDQVRDVGLALRGEYMDAAFFGVGAAVVSMVTSAVCSWELGAEVQDGALRCKLSVGHRRACVYLSSLLLTVLVCLLLCLAVFLPGALVMRLTAGGFAMGWSRAALQMAGVAAAAAAFASLFTLLGLNLQNRAASAIVAIGLTLALVLGGFVLMERLQEVPAYSAHEETEDGSLVLVSVPNPRYVPEGRLRDALTFLNDFNPGGQIMRYTHEDRVDPLPLMAWDAAFFLLSSAAGLLIFRRKDLR